MVSVWFWDGLDIVGWFGDGLGVVGGWLGAAWGWFGGVVGGQLDGKIGVTIRARLLSHWPVGCVPVCVPVCTLRARGGDNEGAMGR